MKLLSHTCFCADENRSVATAESVVDDELAKEWLEVNHGLLQKGFAITEQKRQLEIRKLSGSVSAIIEKFPLLQKIRYVWKILLY